MYKLLVVDDEINIRRGIIKAIQWDDLSLGMAGEAGDGNEALEIIRKSPPDIVLMDMRMPGMDGIELIHALKDQYPSIRLIILSAYSDFDYTKEAIVNKAFDYLLKPVKKDELNKVLSSCVSDLNRDYIPAEDRNQNVHMASAVEDFLTGLILGAYADGEIDMNSLKAVRKRFNFPTVYCGVFKIDDISQTRKLSNPNNLLNQLKTELEELLKKRVQSFAFANRQANEIVAVLSAGTGDEKPASVLAGITTEFRKKRSISVSAGLGGAAKIPEELYTSYMQAKKAVTMKNSQSSCQVISHADHRKDRSGDSENLYYNGELILSTIKSGNTDKSFNLLVKLIGDMAAGNSTIHSIQKNMIILLGDMEKDLYTNGTSIEIECGRSSIQIVNDIMAAYSTPEMEDVIRPVITKATIYYHIKNKKGGKRVVDEIIKNIQKEYPRPISLYAYAKQYFLNPDYLGRIFKNETGKSFADYLTEVRIHKAIELIKNGLCIHYYDVASSVGYEDYSYFCKVFKVFTGQTPGEYKESMRTPE